MTKTKKLGGKTRKNKMPPMKNVSPFTLIGALQDSQQNVIIVNVLAPEKIPIKLTCRDAKNTSNLTKTEFEEHLKQTNNKIDADLVILYCASWSCNAANMYYKSLYDRGISVAKVMDYKGSIHEWSTYSILYPDLFQVILLSNNATASKPALEKLVKDTMHSYMVKDEKKIKKVAKYVNKGIKNKLED